MSRNDDMHVGVSALLIACALLLLPLTAGVVLLTQLNRDDKQISAAPAVNRCDINNDGVVDEKDLEVATFGFGKVTTETGNSSYDLDGDGWINSADLDAISANSAICTKVS